MDETVQLKLILQSDYLKMDNQIELKKGKVYNIDDKVKVEIGDIKTSGEGFGANQFISDLFINIMVYGVPSGVIANIIYDKIMQRGKNQLIDKEKKIIILTEEELTSYINKLYDEKSNK